MKFLKKFALVILILIISLCSFACEGFSLDAIFNTTDYTKLINQVSTQTMKSVITVETKITVSSKFPSVVLSESTYIGSGVIVKIEENSFNANIKKTCYALTNNHVVSVTVQEGLNTKTTVTRTITDYQGKAYEYTVELHSANDDLALISFVPDDIANNQLIALNFATENYNIGGKVISLGSPHGQKNTITFGKITDYKTVNMSPETDTNVSNVTYEVIHHTCPIDSGSSGGVLINYDFEIVGINFAAGISEQTDEFISAYAIPLEKVIAFIGTVLN